MWFDSIKVTMLFNAYKKQRFVEFVDASSPPERSVKNLQHLSSPVEAYVWALTVIGLFRLIWKIMQVLES